MSFGRFGRTRERHEIKQPNDATALFDTWDRPKENLLHEEMISDLAPFSIGRSSRWPEMVVRIVSGEIRWIGKCTADRLSSCQTDIIRDSNIPRDGSSCLP